MFRIFSIDRKVQNLLSERRDKTLNQIMIGLTSMGSTPVHLVLLVFVYYLGSLNQFITFLSVLVFTFTTVEIIKHFSSRERPENQVITASFSSSFPSGHSATSFAFATTISFYYPAVLPFSALVASVVSFSRVYLGEHFLSDAVAGSALGVLTASLTIAVI